MNLQVCDLACGSGHFLIAAAHRIAKRLAFVRTGEEEPGLDAADVEINQALLNARKASKLKGIKTTREYRLPRTVEPWTFASEWAMRHLQRELVREADRLIALDEILCHPELAARFDALAATIKPGLSPLEYRWVALGLRKKGKANPDADDLSGSLDRELSLDDALNDAPTEPGLYLFSGPDLPIFVNHTNNLRSQLRHHVEASGQQLVPDWLLPQSGPVTRVNYISLPSINNDRLQEFRITTIACHRPWLNLLDVTGAV